MCLMRSCPLTRARWGKVGRKWSGMARPPLRARVGKRQRRVRESGGWNRVVAEKGQASRGSGSPPVSRVLLCANALATIHLGDVLPRRSSSLPGSDASRVIASLFGLAPDGVLRAVRVAAHAVGSYPALPPALRRTISTLPDPCGHRRYVFCSTFRRLGPRFRAACCARPLAGILLCGARTFLRACAPRLPGGLPGRILPVRRPDA